AASREERFRTRTLAFFKSFTLPWFAVLGAHKALEHNLGLFSAILVGVLATTAGGVRSEEHTSELQSHLNLVCRLLLEKKKMNTSHDTVRAATATIILCTCAAGPT